MAKLPDWIQRIIDSIFRPGRQPKTRTPRTKP